MVRIDHSEEIKAVYGVDDIKIIKTNFVSDFYVVFCRFSTEAELKSLWDKLNSVISAELGCDFKNDFERWNLYFFYLCEKKVKDSVKYQIENDKYFSRKILIDDSKLKLTSESIKHLISKNIINDDLILSGYKKNEKMSYTSNSIVYNLIDLEKINDKKDSEKLFDEVSELLRKSLDDNGASYEN
ncbi:ABC-three component system middle component 1 [Photobacterium damselae]|uniref:ABC-three component system middle component 1 n=1 Tax=Photobacterium damselae TaxID=38293 RepID=UPI003D7D6547